MSNLLQIDIEKDKVLLEVGRTTSYIGKKRTSADKPVYDRIATVEADDEMLSDFWLEGTDTITVLLKEFRASFSVAKNGQYGIIEGYYADVLMSEFWNTKFSVKVNKLAVKFLVNYIVSRWMMITMSYEDSEKFDKIANDAMSELTEVMYTTERPSYGITEPKTHLYEIKESFGVNKYNSSANKFCFSAYVDYDLTECYFCTYYIGLPDSTTTASETPASPIKRDRTYRGLLKFVYVENKGVGAHSYTGAGACIFATLTDAEKWAGGNDTIIPLATMQLNTVLQTN